MNSAPADAAAAHSFTFPATYDERGIVGNPPAAAVVSVPRECKCLGKCLATKCKCLTVAWGHE